MVIKNKFLRVLVYGASLSLTLFLVLQIFQKPPTTAQDKPYVQINNTRINLEIAQTDVEKTKGLGFRDSLAQDTGMLFVYDQPLRYSFWMEGMRFALDFLWIENNKVEDLHENILPPIQTNNSPSIITPKSPVRYILEVNAGFIKAHTIKIGDPVILKI